MTVTQPPALTLYLQSANQTRLPISNNLCHHLNHFLSHFLSSFLQGRSRSAKVVDLDISMITMGILSPPPYDFVIGHFERQQYCDRVTGLSHLSKESCVHYHAYPPCIRAKHPTFQCNELYISAEGWPIYLDHTSIFLTLLLDSAFHKQ